MADIMLHASNPSGITFVSNAFIDNYMKDANGEYVKIYLYLLRALGSDDIRLDIADIAEKLDHTEKDITRALAYWEKVHLLRLEFNNEKQIVGICLEDPNNGHDSAAAEVVNKGITISKAPVPVETIAKPERPNYSAAQIQAFSEQDFVQELLFVGRQYIKHPLSVTETCSLLYWHEDLGLSVDLIDYLMQICVEGGHTSFHYMDSVARSWKDQGISSISEAKALSKSHSDRTYSIKKAMGISSRDLIQVELDYIDSWVNAGFSVDIICEACKRSVLATNKPSFNYADTIIKNWQASGVHTFDDIKSLDEAFVAKSSEKIQQAKAVNKAYTKKNDFTNMPQREEVFKIEDMFFSQV